MSARQYDPKFTQHVIDTCGPKTSPRMKTIFSALVRHIHDFAREVDLTPEEWLGMLRSQNACGSHVLTVNCSRCAIPQRDRQDLGRIERQAQ